jgi:purine-binding chemotaxis protein CheW
MTDLHVRVRVADEDYALPVTDVLEVADIGDVTPVPGAVQAVLGLKNLRGTVITVVDLAAVMDLSATQPRQRIVVAEEGGRHVALAVDSVVGVESVPKPSETVESRHLVGAALVDGSLVGVIDVKSVLDQLQQRSPTP